MTDFPGAGKKKKRRKEGAGRRGFDDYPDAPINKVEVEDHESGDVCPDCGNGKLYKGTSRKMLSFVGAPPVAPNRIEKEVLRCNGCGKEFMSHTKNPDKWQHSARSAITLQRVFGMPFFRLAVLQGLCKAPIAASTLYMQCQGIWEDCGSVIFERLIDMVSQSHNLLIDDTGARILSVIEDNKSLPEKERRACHTTGIACTTDKGYKLLLYLTSNEYASENLQKILSRNKSSKHYIKLTSDASVQNMCRLEEKERRRIIWGKCFEHARNRFKELEEYHPEECGYFLKEMKCIYQVEGKWKNYCSRKRLRMHKEHSSKHVKNIYSKIEALYRNKEVEPNSELGKAMNYWIRHRKGLTMFLRVKGMVLDTNEVERLLKRWILQRKNSLFYKTKNSAAVLSGLTSLVMTCQENGVNAFEYLNWIQLRWLSVRNTQGLGYLPWDYKSEMGGLRAA